MSDNIQSMGDMRRPNVTLAIFIRVAIAFISGWLLALLFFYLTQQDMLRGSFDTLEGIALSFPLLVGILAPLTMDKHSKHLIFPAVMIGWSALVGAYVYLLPLAMQSDDRVINYYHHGIAIATALLNLAMLASSVLVLLSAVITGLIIKGVRKYHQRSTPRSL